eukprot:7382893-Prymnesium_polylepis.1
MTAAHQPRRSYDSRRTPNASCQHADGYALQTQVAAPGPPHAVAMRRSCAHDALPAASVGRIAVPQQYGSCDSR